MGEGERKAWPFLFSDFTLADCVAERVAEAEAAAGEGAEALIRRLSLNVPVLGATDIVGRQITQPFIDRFHEEVPGGGLICNVAYRYAGDGLLFRARLGDVALTRLLASVKPDGVYINHLRSDDDEAKMMKVIADTRADIDAQLTILRAATAAATADLAARIRAMAGA